MASVSGADPRARAEALGLIRRAALKRIGRKVVWIRSLGPLKTAAGALLRDGLVEQVAPPGGASRNMMKLTPAGLDLLAAVKGLRDA